ncbi:MAG: FAD-dependent monooxygenase [Pseudomonadota bacterium]|nr:FAD-dependent monooxygenase [Pseudomonadota bacterium]
MVGLSLAIALFGVGARFVVIERGSLEDMAAATFDGRGSAVSAGSQRILNDMGLWGPLFSEATAIIEIRVADGSSPLFLHYDHRDMDQGPFGWIVENANIRPMLATEVSDRGLPVSEKAALSAVQFYPSYALLDLSDGRSVNAKLVVAADGRHSAMRKMAGIDAVSWSYPQTGIVCAVQHEISHGGIAHEHFLLSGPFAILPMTRNRSSIVWAERNKLDDASYLNRKPFTWHNSTGFKRWRHFYSNPDSDSLNAYSWVAAYDSTVKSG